MDLLEGCLRKTGMGAVGLINGDGLWKWDFFPEARRLGNWYEDFWGQFLPWIQTAAEFLPGHDLSLHLERFSAAPGASVPFFMSWRGGKTMPSSLSVELIDMKEPGKVLSTSSAATVSSQGDLPRWKGVISAPVPGRYMLRARMQGNARSPMPAVFLDVPSPPGERDNLNADPAWLAAMSEMTGGKRLERDNLQSVLPAMMAPAEDLKGHEEVSLPIWSRWQILLVLLVLLLPPACFWWLRRRNGLL